MQQLSGQDAMFLHAELEGLPQHIGGVSIYNQATAPGGKVRYKDILQTLESRLHLSPIFRRKLMMAPLGLDRPYWVEDPDFDLEYHVRHIALPKPGDWRQLCILVSRLHSRPLARSRPLWEMYVIEGLNNVEGLPPGCFAVLLKVHHAAMDGATGVKFSGAMNDLTPEPRAVAPEPHIVTRQPSQAELLAKAFLHSMSKPGQVLRFLQQAVPAYLRIREGKKKQLFKSLDAKQRTRFQGKISAHRVVEARGFDFDEVRTIKNSSPGATINDVMLTVVAGALRKYLDSKGELPKQTLVTGCPIDVRSPDEREAGGNMVGFMNVALRTDIEDPFERLQAIQKETESSKAYAKALGPRIAMDITDTVPGGILSMAIRTAAATGLSEASVIYNTIVTNVPGSPHQLYFCGAELVDTLSFGPLLPNVGLFHIVLSMVQNKKGTITISFTACRDMLPDPAFYADCLQASYDELKKAALPTSKSRKTARKTPAAKKAKSPVHKTKPKAKRSAEKKKASTRPKRKTRAKETKA